MEATQHSELVSTSAEINSGDVAVAPHAAVPTFCIPRSYAESFPSAADATAAGGGGADVSTSHISTVVNRKRMLPSPPPPMENFYVSLAPPTSDASLRPISAMLDDFLEQYVEAGDNELHYALEILNLECPAAIAVIKKFVPHHRSLDFRDAMKNVFMALFMSCDEDITPEVFTIMMADPEARCLRGLHALETIAGQAYLFVNYTGLADDYAQAKSWGRTEAVTRRGIAGGGGGGDGSAAGGGGATHTAADVEDDDDVTEVGTPPAKKARGGGGGGGGGGEEMGMCRQVTGMPVNWKYSDNRSKEAVAPPTPAAPLTRTKTSLTRSKSGSSY